MNEPHKPKLTDYLTEALAKSLTEEGRQSLLESSWTATASPPWPRASRERSPARSGRRPESVQGVHSSLCPNRLPEGGRGGGAPRGSLLPARKALSRRPRQGAPRAPQSGFSGKGRSASRSRGFMAFLFRNFLV